MAGQTRINGNLIDTGTDPEDIVSISTGDARYPKLDGPNTLTGDLTVDNGTLFANSVQFSTDTNTQPVLITRVGTEDQSLKIGVDDINVVFNSEQDEGGRFGGYIFRSENNGNIRNRLNISSTSGDISFYEDTGTTPKFVWDASAEQLDVDGTLNVDSGTLFVDSANNRVGVGTSSPTEALDVDGTVTADGLTVNGRAVVNGGGFSTSLYAFTVNTTFDRNGLEVLAANTSAKDIITAKNFDGTKEHFNLAGNGDISFYEDTGTTPKFFWDASSERLEIGGGSGGRLFRDTSTAAFHVQGALNHSLIIDSRPNNADEGTLFTINGSEAARIDSNGRVNIGGGRLFSDSNNDFRVQGTNNNNLIIDSRPNNTNEGTLFTINGSEAARITSDGNLLVGKTSKNASATGTRMDPNGRLVATMDNNNPLFLNRLNGDGVIADFRKDTNQVGSISTFNSRMVLGTGNTQLNFFDATDSIRPAASNLQNRDGAIDLGGGAARFKDLYLSGGVYLGGTGSANYLDDYEEGTFTPVIADADVGGNSANGELCDYVKIGKKVSICIGIKNQDLSSFNSSARVYIRNLPFTSNPSGGVNPQAVVHVRGFTFSKYLTAQAGSSSTFINILENQDNGGFDPVVFGQVDSGTNLIFLSITYFTDS